MEIFDRHFWGSVGEERWTFGGLFGENVQLLLGSKIRVFPKIGLKPPKWMVYNGSKPYEQMDDLGGFTTPIFGFNTHTLKSGMYGKKTTWRKHKRPGLHPKDSSC